MNYLSNHIALVVKNLLNWAGIFIVPAYVPVSGVIYSKCGDGGCGGCGEGCECDEE